MSADEEPIATLPSLRSDPRPQLARARSPHEREPLEAAAATDRADYRGPDRSEPAARTEQTASQRVAETSRPVDMHLLRPLLS